MLYCLNCGQCNLMSGEDFYEIRSTSGWERNIVDCENGEFKDYTDGETSDSVHESYECPLCGNDGISTEWDGDIEEAQNTRNEYNERRKQRDVELDLRRGKREAELKAKDPKREWDVMENV